MNELKINDSIFEKIKHIDECGNEYWEARELQIALDYKEWRKFNGVIKKAVEACKNSKINAFEHFVEADKLSKRHNNAKIYIQDYKLSRYACYLIVQNADPRKEIVALGQTYFALQTRRQELNDQQYNELSEDEKRFYQRNLTKKGNNSLNQTAKIAGVKNFDKFHNAGYMGLYNGETANDIAKRKKLRYREEILDNMGSDELIANLFRISQTEQKIKRDNVIGEGNACRTHKKIGKIVRNAIKEAGGIMPENLPKPNKSLKELEKKNKITKKS